MYNYIYTLHRIMFATNLLYNAKMSINFPSFFPLLHSALNPTPTVEVFYAAKALLGEGPFFEPETNQLLWVDIDANSINFLNVDTAQNRSAHNLCQIHALCVIFSLSCYMV